MPTTHQLLGRILKPRCAMGAMALLALIGAFPAYGGSTHYTITFTPTSTGESSARGSFDYDDTTKRFSLFLVEWNNEIYDLANGANNPLINGDTPGSCMEGQTGPAATFLLMTNCPTALMTGLQDVDGEGGNGGADVRLVDIEASSASDNGYATIDIGQSYLPRGSENLDDTYTFVTTQE
jgi:hypothetical protein